jgi:hypothetical protein
MTKVFRWAYGITTVPERSDYLLPTAIKSLASGGFDCPVLFVDGCRYPFQDEDYERFGLKVINRAPAIGTAGTWVLALWELYVRDPEATHFALFQDDIVMSQNVRQYIEHCRYPWTEAAYLNLCTYPQNQDLLGDEEGWHPSNQKGRGAQALVFDRHVMTTLLASPRLVESFLDTRKSHRNLDGKVNRAMVTAGVKEYVHNPSLVTHVGDKSTIKGNNPELRMPSFRGQEFDTLKWAKEKELKT